jgi:hypothetical protein
LIAPTFRVEGNFTDAGNTTQGELRIVDAVTRAVLRRRSFAVRFDDFDPIYRRIVRLFRGARLREDRVTSEPTTALPEDGRRDDDAHTEHEGSREKGESQVLLLSQFPPEVARCDPINDSERYARHADTERRVDDGQDDTAEE